METTQSNKIELRNLFRSITLFLGSAWVIIEATDYFIRRFHYSEVVSDAVLIVLGFGFFSVILVELTHQSAAKRLLKSLQAGNILVCLVTVTWFVQGKEIRNFNFFETGDSDISIAVMPFLQTNDSELSASLAFGIQTEIISQLNTLRAFDVKSPSASAYFKGKDYKPEDVAKSLGVTNLLEGSVVVIDSAFRLTVSLTNALSQSLVWTETFTRPFTDILNLQYEIAMLIVQKLDVDISKKEKKVLAEFPTHNIDAYNDFILGRYHFTKWNPQDNKLAHDYFMEAYRKDPSFVDAYLYQAMTYNLFGGRWLGIMPDSAYSIIQSLVDRAFEYDRRNPLGKFMLSQKMFFYDKNYMEAVEIGLESFPLLAEQDDQIPFLSLMLVASGQGKKSVEILQSYIKKNPTSAFAHQALGNAYVMLGDYENAIDFCHKSMELEPTDIYNLYYIAESQLALGKYDESIATWEKLLSMFYYELFVEGYFRTLYRAGYTEKAMEQYEILDSIGTMPFVMAKAAGTLGDLEKTIKYLEEAHQVNDIEIVAFWRETGFDSLRNEPEIQRMLKEFKLDYLDKGGVDCLADGYSRDQGIYCR